MIDSYEFPPQQDLEEVRNQLQSRIDMGHGGDLYSELQRIDPDTAGRIHAHDYQRITRALEVHNLTKRPISSYRIKQGACPQRYQLAMVGLNRSRDELYKRIDLRVEKMFQDGLVNEVRRLLAIGFESSLKPLRTLGYKQVSNYLEGEYDLDTAIALTKQATRRYAKRQLTWFRRDPRIRWFMLTEETDYDATCNEIMDYICRSIPVHVE